MALFKYSGTAEDLATKKIHDGYVYICSDDDPESYKKDKPLMGQWFVDIGNARYRIAAAALIDSDGNVVNIDDLVQQGDIVTIAQGGTGKEQLTKNALLIGNDEQPIEEIPSTVGALFVDIEGDTPKYGTLPIELGGTNSTNAASARNNLEVYSKNQTDTAINRAMSFSHNATLALRDWNESGDNYVQFVSISDLRCGKNGTVPPLVTWNGTEDSYNAYCKIISAEATPGTGIQFQVSKDDMPEDDVEIIIIDLA